ncbi:hypothetical protein DL762_008915 [Monosporascus cannonballus]|uniref:Uncharacterized protein n=1 Tax=Monosporascus cannonballus TaxID=155416 RepID=A0ABY0GVS8_9PEZI|nr:hypothetical protein DL762_008915 [Monosporascus cannonballus]
MDSGAHGDKKQAVAVDAEAQAAATPTRDADADIEPGEIRLPTGEIVNASGHRQELERNFVSLSSDNFLLAPASTPLDFALTHRLLG